jgi:hypothetical protein
MGTPADATAANKRRKRSETSDCGTANDTAGFDRGDIRTLCRRRVEQSRQRLYLLCVDVSLASLAQP